MLEQQRIKMLEEIGTLNLFLLFVAVSRSKCRNRISKIKRKLVMIDVII